MDSRCPGSAYSGVAELRQVKENERREAKLHRWICISTFTGTAPWQRTTGDSRHTRLSHQLQTHDVNRALQASGTPPYSAKRYSQAVRHGKTKLLVDFCDLPQHHKEGRGQL